MQQSETRIENRFFLNPNRTATLSENLLQTGWGISRQQPLDTLYICTETATGMNWNPSVRVRSRRPIGSDLFTNIPGEFMLKNMRTGEKEMVTAPLKSLLHIQSFPEIASLMGPYLQNNRLAETQFSLYSDRTHFIPDACFNEAGEITSFYPRITIDDNYALHLYQEGKLIESLPFNWAKVEAKALSEQSLASLTKLLTQASARRIETGFIVDQIDMLLEDKNIKIALA